MGSRKDGLRQTELAIAWVRCAAVPLAALEVGVFARGYPHGYERWAWLVTGVLALGAGALLLLALRASDSRTLRRLGLGAVVFDAAIVSAYLFAYSFEPGLPRRELLLLVVVEAAFRFGTSGGLASALAFAPVLGLAEWRRAERFGPDRFVLDHVTFPVVVNLILGLLVGSLALRLRRRADESEHTASLHRAVLEAAGEGIILADPGGHILVMNSTAREIGRRHGLTNEASLGEILGGAASRTADPDRFLAVAEAIAADPEHSGRDEWTLAPHAVFERYTSPVRDSAGALLGRIFVLRDVTAERAGERAKSELLGTVSHELRTPLTSIRGFAELLANFELDSETARSYGKLIEEQAGRLAAIVEDLLDLQRLEVGERSVATESIELGALLEQQVERIARESPDHTFVLDAPERPLAILGDPGRVAQVVDTLLSNAVAYSPPSRIDVRATRVDGVVRVSVVDSGIGIAAEQHKHVFQKFFRADVSDTRTVYGAGLGLAVSRELVAAHGGRIGFESAEHEGSTFWFELPAV